MNQIYFFCLLIIVVATIPHFMGITEPDKYISISKDIALAITAIVGSYVGISGLKTWERQLKGNAEYDLARRLLKCTYQWRDAIQQVRNPLGIGGAETSNEYQKRWDGVSNAKNELYTDLIEAEAIWGKDIYENLFTPLLKLQYKLLLVVQDYLGSFSPDISREERLDLQKKKHENWNILFGSPLDIEDKYTQDINIAIEKIESFLKPYIHK